MDHDGTLDRVAILLLLNVTSTPMNGQGKKQAKAAVIAQGVFASKQH